MPGVNLNADSMSLTSIDFEKIDSRVIEKQAQALGSLLSKAKTQSFRDALKRFKSILDGEGTASYSDLGQIYNDLMQSLNEEHELDRSLVCIALGLDAELDNASDLEDLIKVQIAGFSQEKLLEMLYFSQISYGDGESKLEKKGFKTRKQFKDKGYQIIKFYENELIQDEYCQDNDYKLEKRDVDCALKASNSCTRDAGCIFIGENGEVTIAYHGTRDNKDDMSDLNALLTEVQFSDKKVGSIHRGFYSLFKRSWPNVHKILQGHANNKELKEGIKDLKINVTGHSMGGALATIAALCLKETESVKDVHVATFGSPRALYQDSAGAYSKCLGEKTIKVAFQSDPVPCLPFGGGGQYYKHVGKPLKLETGSRFNPSDHSLSKYLEFIGNIKQEIFKSDDNVSKYFQLARLFGVVCSNFPKDILFSNDKEFFEKVKEENKDIKLSEIPLHILRSEKELKQAKQERHELNDKVNTLTEKLENKSKELDDASQALDVKTQALESTQTQLKKLQKDSDAKTKEFEDTKAQLEQERDSVKQELDKTTEELRRKEADLENSKKDLDNVNEKVLQLQGDLEQEQQKINGLTTQVTQLKNAKEELESTQAQLEKLQKGSDAKTKEFEDTKAQLEQELDSAQQSLNEKTEKLNSKDQEMNDVNQKLEEFKNIQAQLERERDSVKQELDKTTEELRRKEADLENSKKDLDNVNEKVSKLEHETLNQQASINDLIASEKNTLTEELKNKSKKLDDANKALDIKISEVTQLTEENTQLQSELESIRKTLGEKDSTVTQLTEENTKLKNELKLKKPENNDLKTKLQESESKSKGLESRVENLQKQLESKNKELNGKNERFLGASTQSRKQVTYASVSFVLSGALAVGASLTMFHLAMCITLAVAALTFLAVGCYCSYKANTALSNVEIDQIENGVDHVAA